MTIRHGPEIILACLVTLTLGAMGIMVSSIKPVHVNGFDIRIDDDSLRTAPLIQLIEEFYGSNALTLPLHRIVDELSGFQQVEQVIARKTWTGTIYVDIVTRKPVLRISNRIDDPVCIAPDGTPFPYWPEHGPLPTCVVPGNWTRERMLSPDPGIRKAYGLLLRLVDSSPEFIRCYTEITQSQPFDVVLAESGGGNCLRLSLDTERYPEEVLRQIDLWILGQPEGPPREFDARFPGIILIKPEGVPNG